MHELGNYVNFQAAFHKIARAQLAEVLQLAENFIITTRADNFISSYRWSKQENRSYERQFR